ncbi:TatD family hydrolase, partial [archaeon]|nr:TatD family hydrolase [archaeon]
MIDSHAHLDSKELISNINGVVERAKKSGINAVVNPTTSFSSNQKALELSEKFPGFVFPCAGLDPVYAAKEKKKIGEVSGFAREHAKEIVGIGETGLEYKWMPASKAEQKKTFAYFIVLANELRKPVV